MMASVSGSFSRKVAPSSSADRISRRRARPLDGRLLVGDLGEVGRCADRVTDSEDLRRHGDDVAAADAGAARRGPAGARGRCATARRGRHTAPSAGSTPSRRWSSSATASTGGVRSRTWRERRADGDDDVLEARRAEHPDGARRRLLERLEQGVGRRVGVGGEPVGVLDDDDAPAAHRRPEGGELDELRGPRATLMDRPSVATTSTSAWLPSRAVRHSRHSPAAAGGALERGRERPCRRRAPRAGRTGEEPRVRHRGLVGHRPRQRLDGRALAHEVMPTPPLTSPSPARMPSGCSQQWARCRAAVDHGRGVRAPGLDLGRGQRRVEDEVALGLARGELEVAAAHGGVEVVGLGLEPVVDVTAPRRGPPRA